MNSGEADTQVTAAGIVGYAFYYAPRQSIGSILWITAIMIGFAGVMLIILGVTSYIGAWDKGTTYTILGHEFAGSGKTHLYAAGAGVGFLVVGVVGWKAVRWVFGGRGARSG